MIAASDEARACSCAGAMTDEAWRELPLDQTIPDAVIRQHVCEWPAHACVEVRRCACGRAIARKVQGRAE